MKQKILIIGLLVMASLKCMAQDVEYYYDAAGNRYARQVIGAALPATPPADIAEVNTPEGEADSETEPAPEVYEDLQLVEKQLMIYPNPTRGKLAIEIVNFNFNETGSIQVFDMSGRLVQNITNISQNLEVDITNEPAGSYIMVIVIGQEKSEWKIIKN